MGQIGGKKKSCWRHSPPPGLPGVEDLISEDCYYISIEERIAIAFNELLSAAGRGDGVTIKACLNNWRQFCGLPEIAISGGDD